MTVVRGNIIGSVLVEKVAQFLSSLNLSLQMKFLQVFTVYHKSRNVCKDFVMIRPRFVVWLLFSALYGYNEILIFWLHF